MREEKLAEVMITRPVDNDDLSFIFSSWMRSFKQSYTVRPVPSKIYHDNQKQIIEYIIARSEIIIACNAEDPAHIFGWACYEIEPIHTLHYVYVKQPYRSMGIASALLIQSYNAKRSASAPTQATHSTKGYTFLQTSFDMIYNPFYLWEIYASAKINEN
jgi:GNAT superfamily N-acetyltransferase|tara:strand:- start:1305 stop:1781 length:477 start_codon:yes stop_codon:yes gene_type:complete